MECSVARLQEATVVLAAVELERAEEILATVKDVPYCPANIPRKQFHGLRGADRGTGGADCLETRA